MTLNIVTSDAGTSAVNGTYVWQGANPNGGYLDDWWLNAAAGISLVHLGNGLWYFAANSSGTAAAGIYHSASAGSNPVAANWAAGGADSGTPPQPVLSWITPDTTASSINISKTDFGGRPAVDLDTFGAYDWTTSQNVKPGSPGAITVPGGGGDGGTNAGYSSAIFSGTGVTQADAEWNWYDQHNGLGYSGRRISIALPAGGYKIYAWANGAVGGDNKTVQATLASGGDPVNIVPAGANCQIEVDVALGADDTVYLDLPQISSGISVISVPPPDTTAPVLSNVIVDNDGVTVHFIYSDASGGVTITDSSKFTLQANGQNKALSNFSVDGLTVTATCAKVYSGQGIEGFVTAGGVADISSNTNPNNNDDSEGTNNSEQTAPVYPGVANAPTFSNVSFHTLRVSWGSKPAHTNSIDIWRKAGSSSWAKIITGAEENGYEDETGLTKGTVYQYKVVANGDGGLTTDGTVGTIVTATDDAVVNVMAGQINVHSATDTVSGTGDTNLFAPNGDTLDHNALDWSISVGTDGIFIITPPSNAENADHYEIRAKDTNNEWYSIVFTIVQGHSMPRPQGLQGKSIVVSEASQTTLTGI